MNRAITVIDNKASDVLASRNLFMAFFLLVLEFPQKK